MTKFLFWFVLLSVAFAWLRHQSQRQQSQRQQTQNQPSQGSSSDTPASAEKMLACAECGVHFPASEAVYAQTDVFCSAAHCGAFLARQSPPRT
jgi:uncharacterized protein